MNYSHHLPSEPTWQLPAEQRDTWRGAQGVGSRGLGVGWHCCLLEAPGGQHGLWPSRGSVQPDLQAGTFERLCRANDVIRMQTQNVMLMVHDAFLSFF